MSYRENAKHRAAFEVWYKVGRDYAKACEVLQQKGTIAERTVYEWSKRYDWHTRADVRDAEVERRNREKAIQQKVDMLERHANLGKQLQKAGYDYISKTNAIDKASDAISAVRVGVQTERQAAGLPDWVAGIINASDEDLLNEYRDLRAALSGQTPPLESDGDGTDPARLETGE